MSWPRGRRRSPRSSSARAVVSGGPAIEREARRTLDEGLVQRLETLGLLRPDDAKALRAEVAELASSVRAVEELQAWVERRLYTVREGLTLSAE
jgi:hypothetical protein